MSMDNTPWMNRWAIWNSIFWSWGRINASSNSGDVIQPRSFLSPPDQRVWMRCPRDLFFHIKEARKHLKCRDIGSVERAGTKVCSQFARMTAHYFMEHYGWIPWICFNILTMKPMELTMKSKEHSQMQPLKCLLVPLCLAAFGILNGRHVLSRPQPTPLGQRAFEPQITVASGDSLGILRVNVSQAKW